jgi:hypothetical protein
MTHNEVVSRDEWLRARKALLPLGRATIVLETDTSGDRP